MREIKFKAWNKEKKLMFNEVLELDFREYDPERKRNWVSKVKEGMPEVMVSEFNTYDGEGDTNNFISSKDVILMQFTGLKDKNGKEIYEGDIVKAPYNDLCEYHEVSYNSGCYFVGVEILSSFHEEDLEVIGNIYENPELLEEKNE